MKKTFFVFLALTIIVIGAIFIFSHQNAEKSTETSDVIVNKIVNEKTYDPSCGKPIETLKKETEVIVRKTAHFTLYTLLGFFAFMTLYNSNKLHKNYILFIISIVFCIIYAISDEVHQYFMDGRACKITDVLIDSAGSCTGIALAFLTLKLCKKEIFFIKLHK